MEYMELEWPLMIFTFFMCLAGGIFATQGLLTLRGKGKAMQMYSLVATFINFAIGGIGVFMHLQHWERMFNGFGHITSPITHEVIGCVVMGVAIVCYFLFMRQSEEGVAPKWACIFAIVIGLILPVLCGRSYDMAADPVWNTPLMQVFYFTDTLLIGSLFVMILAKFAKCDDVYQECGWIFIAGAVLRLIVVFAYAGYIYGSAETYADYGYYFDPTLPDTAMIDVTEYTNSVLAGACSGYFYGLVVAVGSIPAILFAIAMVAGKSGILAKLNELMVKNMPAVVAIFVCAIIGSWVWRFIQYWVCIKVYPYFHVAM